MSRNPFELVTASKLRADEASELWCDDSRLDRVRGRESCFINGNRGTGKSMLFRILQPDCQELLFPGARSEFLSVYFSVRDSDFMIEELQLLKSNRMRNALSESHLILLILRQLFVTLRGSPELVPMEHQGQFARMVVGRLRSAFEFGESGTFTEPDTGYEATLEWVLDLLDAESQQTVNYIVRQLYGPEQGYGGPLFFFDGILGPIADFFHAQVGRCLFILIDDGDDLPLSHTIVLNSWIGRRRASTVFKVSTMYAYKTFETRSGSTIQEPHDFVQYDIATRFIEYGSEDYVDLLRQICLKRLVQLGLRGEDGQAIDPEVFLPEDEEQEERLAAVRRELTEEYRKRYSGRAVGDNVYRHLSSEYMRRLNAKKSLGSYRYAGFKTLAILSGGLVRDFLIGAQRMYDNAARQSRGDVVDSISPEIQNRIVREHADRVLQDIGDCRKKRSGTEEEWRAVANMVSGLGRVFRGKMLSEDSERRVFSFAFQSEPSPEVLRLLDLAAREGYVVRGFISKKEGGGRRVLYVLTRRLAPAFSLDVSSYSGYLSVGPSSIERLAAGRHAGPGDLSEQLQGDLFSDTLGPEGPWIICEPEGGGELVVNSKRVLIAAASFEERSTVWIRQFLNSGGSPESVFCCRCCGEGSQISREPFQSGGAWSAWGQAG